MEVLNSAKPQGPPVVDIPTAATISEGLKSFGEAGVPFIVRGVSAFDLDYEHFKERAAKERLETIGWNRRLELVTNVSVASALEQWENGSLQLNFVDSLIPKYVRNEGIHKDLLDIAVNEDRLMLTMSKQGAYTPFHQDPIVSEEGGAGYMWLLQGSKRWHFLTNDHSDAIFDPDLKTLNDLPADVLVAADNGKLWGKLMQVHARAGDFLYIPPGCTHRVWTDEASFGVTGYFRRVEDEKLISKAVAWYEKVGIDPAKGIFRLDRVAASKSE